MLNQSRSYIRHPVDIPIAVSDNAPTNNPSALHNISEGGLAFCSDKALPVGQLVSISIPCDAHPFNVDCVVVWSRKKNRDCFDTGVVFTSADDSFKVRMVEQICQIESYKRAREKELGEPLDWNTAANEWISQFAHEFPGAHS